MNKTLTSMIVLGATAALMSPVAPAWADRGSDDSGGSSSGRGRDHQEDDGSDDHGTDDSTDDSGNDSPGDDDGTPDQGRGDNGADDSPGSSAGGGQSSDDRGKGRGRSRGKAGRVEVRESGVCSDASKWRIRIRVRGERGRIKFQVKTQTVGQEWSYRVVDNGTEILAGTKVTRGRSADFGAKRKWRGVAAGSHEVTASAENLETGETCSGSANA